MSAVHNLPKPAVAALPKPAPDRSEMIRAIEVLGGLDFVVELRSISSKGKKRTDAGYFDFVHRTAMADEAVRLNKAGAAVYLTMNPVDPQLLGRYNNRVEAYAPDTSTDANVVCRRHLLIDLDPVRPKNTAATDDQVEATRQRGRDCFRYLKALGWPDPIVAESGNGVHLIYPVDLTNDAESTLLIKNVLAGLAAKLDDGVVQVDQAVFNASRITKLYGSVATKGDHLPGAPWRLSRIVSAPTRSSVVTVEQLRAVHPVADAPRQERQRSGSLQAGQWDFDQFMLRLGIGYTQDVHEGSERFKLAHCPFNADHGQGEAAIFRRASGALGFRCFHNGCRDRTWDDVRELVDGPRSLRSSVATVATVAVAGAPDLTHSGDFDPGNNIPLSWPGPHELSVKVDAQPYPVDAIPTVIRAAVDEVRAFVQAPMPLVVSSALSALSLAAQAHVDVRRADKLEGPTSLFFLLLALSGERKSTLDGFFTKTHRDYEIEQAELAKPELKKHAAELSAWSAERDGILAAIKEAGRKGKEVGQLRNDLVELEGTKPEAPRVPRLIYGDATPEALTWSLAKSWPSGGVISSEAGAVFGAHGMGRESIMRTLATLNELWDGKPQRFDRRTSESFTVRGARLTVALQVQEETLREFYARSGSLARGSGFLARFLVAWPDSTQGRRLYAPPPATWPALGTFHRRIADILADPAPINEAGVLTPLMLELSPEAKVAWVSFHDAIESELAGGGDLESVRDVASKAADNAARLAALFHCFAGRSGAIREDDFEGASRIVAWHLNESRRFFGELALPPGMANAGKLDAWLLEFCAKGNVSEVATRTVLQTGPPPLRDRSALEAATRELEEFGRARIVKQGRRKVIAVNPALLGGNG